MKTYEVTLMGETIFCGTYGACEAFIEGVRSAADGEYFGLPAEDAAYSCHIKEFNEEK